MEPEGLSPNISGRSGIYVVRLGSVVSIEDENGAGRIKVKLPGDPSEGKWAFPLLPKTLQPGLKKGECVLVILAELNSKNSNRYYLGPVISQYQDFYSEKYTGASDRAGAALDRGSLLKLYDSIDNFDATLGAFPSKDSVALIGRKDTDIELLDGEVNIRCGVRQEITDSTDINAQGYIKTNFVNPADVSMFYDATPILTGSDKMGKDMGANSVTMIIADKVNLVSNEFATQYANNVYKQGDNGKQERKSLLDKKDLQEMVKNLHNLPYGDMVVSYLEILRRMVLNHWHPFPGVSPYEDDNYNEVANYDLTKILSPDVRIS